MIKVVSIRNIRHIFSMRNMKLIDELKPDIIHLTGMYPQLSAFVCLYGLSKKYPIVYTLHRVHRPFMFSPAKAGAGGIVMAAINVVNDFTTKLIKPDMIIVHTAENRDVLIRRRLDPEKVAVIPHGAFSFFARYNHNETSADENCVLLFGYLSKVKGIEYLIEAMGSVCEKIPDAKLVIAGEGDISAYRKYIRDSRQFEVHNHYIPDEMVPCLFQRAKIVALPYLYHEGHSGVLATAFGFGKPVIVTNLGDFPNLVEDGREGLVVPAKDSQGLAQAIVKLLRDDSLRQQMGENSRKKAQELSWANIAKKHLEVYQRAKNSLRGNKAS